MKKLLFIFFTIIIAFTLLTSVVAASVTPVEFPGNDANSYTPPEGCIRTTLPDSDIVGTHVYKFNNFGQLDPAGTNTFTLVVGIAPSTSYTQVLSWTWSGSYPLFAVIVKGGPGFNLYEYDGGFTSDTNLVSPVNPSGNPADISHVSVVLCPNGEPPVPPTPDTECCIIIIVLLAIIILLLVAVLVVLVNIKCILYCCCKKHHFHIDDSDC